MDIGLEEAEFDGETVSYFVTSYLEKLPSKWEQFVLDIRDHENSVIWSLLFDITEIENNTIGELRVCKQ
jgi:hypothetical protein